MLPAFVEGWRMPNTVTTIEPSTVNIHGYSKGMEVPFHFQSGVIIASYFVSLVGSITTVELLHRKREGKGWTPWLQQLAIAVSFGLVAIWCMHFVGNRAIVLGNGEKELQLYYNPGFTTLSVFLPIVFLFLGFTTVELRQPGQAFFWPSLVVAGIVAGLAITGMHYVGNFGINNYTLVNPPQFVVGAGLIAITACCIALALFFYFKGKWINSFPRRVACACLLAGAVSGMHWTASIGTRYTLRDTPPDRLGMSRDTNLIVAIVLSLLACVVCFAFGLLTQRRKKQLADRAQHVMLASVTFDPDGKLLVTQEGILPAQKVTRQYNQRSFNDEFNTAHPVFQWLFRVTFNWTGVADLIPGMRSHLRTIGATSRDPTRPMTPSTESAFADDSNSNEDYSIIFREHFCVAASQLAGHLEVSIQELGILYNGIMMTGSLAPEFLVKKSSQSPSRVGLTLDVEAGYVLPTMFGSGQLLFLVRTVDKAAALKLMTVGYRFAQTAHVGDIIARSMQVPHHEMVSTISKLQAYSKQNLQPLEQPGYCTYLACYAMRAAVNKANSSWEVLVAQDNPFQLPQVELTQNPLKPWQQKILQRLDGLSANQCLSWLNNKASECSLSDDKEFLELLLDQVTALTIGVPEPFFGQAIFSSKAVHLNGTNNGMPICMYAFCIIPDIHASSLKSKNKLTYVPLSFFKCFQRIYKGSPDHAILSRKIHREFGSILNAKGLQEELSPITSHRDSITSSILHSAPRPKRQQWAFRKSSCSSSTRRSSILKPDFASEKGLTEESEAPGTAQPFGGIMVSNDTTVEISAKQESMTELQEMGLKTEAGVGASEQPTYVDELFQIASQKWRQH
ncbi:hypothetical protein EG328_005406 [Venturia inaequalis]|uniref:MHYT domain-containing protein n=1 Tax=Venturia inaequalis TaxID=5025 RepID=A0A8H3VEL5_VENIN|nr:hypothetical protein EG328_005406 [Venturia inaequalis]KAE9992424.1 hypothetical protein EG327_009066 [Venturia inaequalis]RDI82407.1 hypothetical protein Vi05172_g7613 [Venturia inaequalis]